MYKLTGVLQNMKNVYLLDFQEYLNALGFKFTIQYYNNGVWKLDVENEDGEVKTIYEDNNDDASAHIIDYQIQNFLCSHIQNILLPYDDLNIIRYYSPWQGFVIAGKIFNIEDCKDDYNVFLKNILHFVEQCTKD